MAEYHRPSAAPVLVVNFDIVGVLFTDSYVVHCNSPLLGWIVTASGDVFSHVNYG
jgi:hypothetical protein